MGMSHLVPPSFSPCLLLLGPDWCFPDPVSEAQGGPRLRNHRGLREAGGDKSPGPLELPAGPDSAPLRSWELVFADLTYTGKNEGPDRNDSSDAHSAPQSWSHSPPGS